MTTFTNKELIKEIKERISSLTCETMLSAVLMKFADSWLSKGWYVQPLYMAQPVSVVPDGLPSLNNGIVGFDEGWNSCRTAMLHGAEPVSQTYKVERAVGQLSGNSGWLDKL